MGNDLWDNYLCNTGNRVSASETLLAPVNGVQTPNKWTAITVLDSGSNPAVGALVSAADGSGIAMTDSQGKASLWLDNTGVQVTYGGNSLTSALITGDTTLTLPDAAHTSTQIVDDSGQGVANVPLYLFAGVKGLIECPQFRILKSPLFKIPNVQYPPFRNL